MKHSFVKCVLPFLLITTLTCSDKKQFELFIVSIDPNSAEAGGPAFGLTVNVGGDGLQSTGVRNGSTRIQWNGQERPTSIIDQGTAVAAISAEDISVEGVAQVTISFNIENFDITDPTEGLVVSQPVSFTIGPPQISSISIVPTDTTVTVGDTVPYRALALVEDPVTGVPQFQNVTSEVVWGSSDVNVAGMVGEVAFTVAPGVSEITGTHISGVVPDTATLTVTAPGGGSDRFGIVLAALGSDAFDVLCYDATSRAFGAPTPIDVGESVLGLTAVADPAQVIVRTPLNFHAFSIDPTGCSADLQQTSPIANSNALSSFNGTFSDEAGILAIGDVLAGNQVRLFQLGAGGLIAELAPITAVGGAIGSQMAWSTTTDHHSLLFRAGVTPQVASSPRTGIPNFITWDPQPIDPSVSQGFAERRGPDINSPLSLEPIAWGAELQSFVIDPVAQTLTPIGTPTSGLTLNLINIRGFDSCIKYVPQSGNQSGGGRLLADGTFTPTPPTTLEDADFIDGSAVFKDVVFLWGPTLFGSTVQATDIDGGDCSESSSTSIDIPSDPGFILGLAFQF